MSNLIKLQVGHKAKICPASSPIESVWSVIDRLEAASIRVVFSALQFDHLENASLTVETIHNGRPLKFEAPAGHFRQIGDLVWCSIEYDEPMFVVDQVECVSVRLSQRCGFIIPDLRRSATHLVNSFSIVGFVDECSVVGFTAAFDDESGTRLVKQKLVAINLAPDSESPLIALAEPVQILSNSSQYRGIMADFKFVDLSEDVRPRLEVKISRQLLSEASSI